MIRDEHEALRAVCRAAGWQFCEEHKLPRWNGTKWCGHLHKRAKPEHTYTCPYPERDCLGAPCARLRGDL